MDNEKSLGNKWRLARAKEDAAKMLAEAARCKETDLEKSKTLKDAGYFLLESVRDQETTGKEYDDTRTPGNPFQRVD